MKLSIPFKSDFPPRTREMITKFFENRTALVAGALAVGVTLSTVLLSTTRGRGDQRVAKKANGSEHASVTAPHDIYGHVQENLKPSQQEQDTDRLVSMGWA